MALQPAATAPAAAASAATATAATAAASAAAAGPAADCDADVGVLARERDDHALKNASSIPSNELWKCNVYGTIDNPPS